MTSTAQLSKNAPHVGPVVSSALPPLTSDNDAGGWDEPVAVRETHVGVVVLLGRRAYKLKKPVRTGFLDFSTQDKRRAACRRELELNCRLAPDVYLGLAHVSDDRLGVSGLGADTLDEPVLVMRRMPDNRRLASLVRAGAPVRDDLRSLAKQMAAFHSRAERSPEIDAEGSRGAVHRRWAANIAELHAIADCPLDGHLITEIESRALRFLAGREPLFSSRIAAGRVVDGHGDLIADDVFCLDDGPRALDCLEFDDRLRYLDGLDDVAFLAMDLERLGHAELAEAWLVDYREFSADPAPDSLRHHYVAYRALVRAKVACLRHQQGDAEAATEAHRYAALCLRHLVAGAVRLALVGGLPGTGKTTLAGGLADRFGAVVLSSDRIRKETNGIDPSASAAAGYGEGLYSPERTEALYEELLHRAEVLLGMGESVILDASWTSLRHRRRAEDLARRTGNDLVRLQCRATAETAGRRIATRPPNPSDATVPVATAMAKAADLWPEAVAVPTVYSIEKSLDVASAAWRAAG